MDDFANCTVHTFPCTCLHWGFSSLNDIFTNLEDPTEAWDHWKWTTFVNGANKHAPTKKRKIHQFYVPWLTPELKRLMFERDRTKNWLSSKEMTWPHGLTIGKLETKLINTEVKRCKTEYYNSFFKDREGQTKKTWDGINQLLGRQPKRTQINNIELNGTTYTDPPDVANALNTHFTEIGPKLSSKISKSDANFTTYLPARPKSSFCLRATTAEEVYKLIQKMQCNKASGTDNISARLLKEAARVISSSLAHIFNLSISKGIFPRDWKEAKMCPIYKEGLKTDPNNYRPISVLPAVSKLIEKIIFKQWYDYLTTIGPVLYFGGAPF